MMKWKKDSDMLIIYLKDEIDHCAAGMLREQIEEAISVNAPQTLLFDLTNVTFMDSSAIGMLIGRYKSMAARGGKTLARGLSTPLERLFRMAGLHRIIPIVQEERRKEA